MEIDYKRKLFIFLGIISCIKLLVAGCIELGNDEVYYYTYALQPDYNHFDHPPLIGFLIQLTTFNLHWVNDVTMRLGAIVGCAVSSYFVFRTGSLLYNSKTGWYAALLYNVSVYTGIIAGLFILPDSPQMLFYTASLWLMAQIITKPEANKSLVLWLSLGLSIGLASLSKVHGVYLWVGFGLFMLIKRRKWLFNYRVYFGVLVTLLCLLPILYWNIQNQFITYKFHSERVTHTSLQWDSLLQEIVGEMLYQNPVVFVTIILAIVGLVKRVKNPAATTANIWLWCMGLPMLFFFWGIALFNPTLPHWSGPGYIPFFIITAQWLSEKTNLIYPIVTKIAGGLMALVVTSAIGLVWFAPFNLGNQSPEKYGEYCPTLDISGWRNFGKDFNTLVTNDIVTHHMQPNAPLLVGKWFPAGHILFYVSRITHQQVLGIGALQDVHKFAWLNKMQPTRLQLGGNAYCIVPSNVPFDVTKEYSTYFAKIEHPVIINQMRGGKAVRYFFVYRLKNCVQVPPLPL